MKTRKHFLFLFLTVLGLSTIFCYFGFLIPIGERNVHELPFVYYEFDAETAFKDIKAGNLPTVSEIEEERYDFKQIPSRSNLVWTETELLGIQAGILKQMGISNHMNVNMLIFIIPCNKTETGAEFANYYISSLSIQKDGLHRLNLDVSIFPFHQKAVVYPQEYYPIFSYGERVINMGKLKFSYLDVLRIAEENGGEDVREQIQNNCTIRIMYAPGNGNKNWQVRYEKGRTLLELNIDDKTGNIVLDKKKN